MDKIQEIRKALEAATPGPWKVHETIYETDKPYLAERQIGTAYHHPQLRGPDSVVALGTCLYQPRHRVYISAENAHLIANAPEWLSYLLTELDAAKQENERLRNKLQFVENQNKLWQKRVKELEGADGDYVCPEVTKEGLKLKHAIEALEWIEKRYEEEWTFESGTGEVVEEIIQAFSLIREGE